MNPQWLEEWVLITGKENLNNFPKHPRLKFQRQVSPRNSYSRVWAFNYWVILYEWGQWYQKSQKRLGACWSSMEGFQVSSEQLCRVRGHVSVGARTKVLAPGRSVGWVYWLNVQTSQFLSALPSQESIRGEWDFSLALTDIADNSWVLNALKSSHSMAWATNPFIILHYRNDYICGSFIHSLFPSRTSYWTRAMCKKMD